MFSLSGYLANVPYTRKGPFEIGDSIPVKANLTGVPQYIRLDVLKSHIESVAGIDIERNKLYEIKGRVEEAYDFDIYRTVGKYVYLIPSLEQRERVRPGRVYDVKIESVREVPLTESQREILGGPQKRGSWRSTMYRLNHVGTESKERLGPVVNRKVSSEGHLAPVPERMSINATFALQPWLHKWGQPRYEFTIPNKDFEKKTGVKVEEMRDYSIKLRIDGVGEFEKKIRRCAAGQDIPIYIPARFNPKVARVSEYKVTIHEIERLPRRRTSAGIAEGKESLQWTWRDVASWIDGEGCIISDLGGGSYGLYVAQKEKAVLETLGVFFEKEGFNPKLRLDKREGVYRLQLDGAEQAARVIKNITPFIRTVHRREQIAAFKESLLRERKYLRPEIRIARKILGLGEA